MPRLPLPAELIGPTEGDAYLAQPTSEHVERSMEALTALAAQFDRFQDVNRSRVIEVQVTHVDHGGLLSPRLQVFNLLPIVRGQLKSPFEVDLPLVLATPVNLPVSLQSQCLLSSISQLVARQSNLPSVAAEKNIEDLDRRSADWDTEAQNRVADVLRHGWEAAAEVIARDAHEHDMNLRLRYVRTPKPDPNEIAARSATGRRIYNRFEIVRGAVDRFAAHLSALMLVHSQSLPGVVIDAMNEAFEFGRARLCLAHALRDSLVCGNGYVSFGEGQPMSVRALQPDRARADSDQFVRPSEDGSPEPGIHIAGLHQLGCEYGLSLLEPAFQILQMVELFEGVLRTLDASPDPTSPSILEDARRFRSQVESQRSRADNDGRSRLAEMYALFKNLPEPDGSPYFPGRELYEDPELA